MRRPAGRIPPRVSRLARERKRATNGCSDDRLDAARDLRGGLSPRPFLFASRYDARRHGFTTTVAVAELLAGNESATVLVTEAESLTNAPDETTMSSSGGSATDAFEELATGGEQRSFVGSRS